jgi:calcineurin-like phosphoesterase family protein
MIYFTSDTHFGHANVIKYCARPFADVAEMNAEMVRRWNARVRPEDTVYHLGDFAFGPQSVACSYRPQLNGRVILVRGNHDGSMTRCRRMGFDDVFETMTVDGAHLSHHPPGYNVDDGLYLCGHVHEQWKVRDWVTRPGLTVINVGVDQWGFRPVTVRRPWRGAMRPLRPARISPPRRAARAHSHAAPRQDRPGRAGSAAR